MTILFLIVFILLQSQCNSGEIQGEWLRGSAQTKLSEIETQFRGFDVAMAEIGYRYQELYWAALSMNWEYADHQLEHMEISFRNALKRRPHRESSGQIFLDEAIPKMVETIALKDTALFRKEFLLFTAHCNLCHTKEEHDFIQIQIPAVNRSIVK
ncbi:MAG TPA: hypothetical protein PKC30_15465 [Saprospiraceae bacterium]|nr:hypothetical protein [Saprospiraceae bacterium]